MNDQVPSPRENADLAERLRMIRARTSARILVGRAGVSYKTSTQLELRLDHAAALDAVRSEVDLLRDFEPEFVDRWGLFEVASRAGNKAEYLARPDLGRRLGDASQAEIARRCPTDPDVQVVIGDGLSAAAVVAQVPDLLPRLAAGAGLRHWQFGRPFFVRYARVGILNNIGETLRAGVVILLIGERPGLTTSESLSAYLAFRPRTGHTDARRNLIANIHARGVDTESAARRILNLAARMISRQSSGIDLKEQPNDPDGPSLACPKMPTS